MRWFKHMVHSANDEKLSRLRDTFGLEGYGFWWSVVEIIAEKVDENEDSSVTFSAKKWGNLLGISAKKFQTLAEFCANLGLFSIKNVGNELTIYMPNILKFRDEWSGRKARNSGVTREKLPPSRARVPDPYPDTDPDTEQDKEKDTPLPPPGECVCAGPDPVDAGGKIPEPKPVKAAVRFIKPTPDEVEAYCQERKNGISGQEFCDFYEAKGWFVGKNPMKDWQAAVRTWENARKNNPLPASRASSESWLSPAQRRQEANQRELQKFVNGEV